MNCRPRPAWIPVTIVGITVTKAMIVKKDHAHESSFRSENSPAIAAPAARIDVAMGRCVKGA